MDVVQEKNCGVILKDGGYNEKLFSPESPDEFRDPELLPRVGDQYQAEIPPLMAEYECLWPPNGPTGAKLSCDIPHEVLVGLPISVMWIKEEAEDIKHDSVEGLVDSTDASKCNKETEVFSEVGSLKPEEMKVDIGQKLLGKGYRLVPGSAADAWSDSDEASFLLGLYIFGKNLVQVKKFIESKTMGEILTFYYGKFYRSGKYRRWSECRKIRSRKCIYGQKIFTGFKHQELFSHLLLNVSEECKKSLLEDTKALGDGKMLLEEYVLGLRDKVGLNALVEAVGIGKGKKDLTGMAMEPPRSNHVAPVRPELPTGKAISKLTTSEIINFLTGGRLSKGRSYEIFWDAVWPRLLARGWHSEQPDNPGSTAGSRNSLVFLIPGIKKFSRRKLVKGSHYFDSVSDVLSKVAEDPALLELENVKDKNDGNKEGNGWTNETKLDREASPDQQRQRYLKPRTSNRVMEFMKFTVVDTSMANGEGFNVRELRSLPVELSSASTSTSQAEDSKEETSEESTDEADSTYTMCSDRYEHHRSRTMKVNVDRGISLDRNASNTRVSITGADSTDAPAVKVSNQKNNDQEPRKTAKSRLSRRRRPESDINLAPVTKGRRRLHACDHHTETTVIQGNAMVGAKFWEGNADASEKISLQVEISQEKLSSTNSSSKGSPVVSSEGTLGSTCSVVEHPHEEPPPRREIDLNLPIQPEADTDELFMMERSEYDQTSIQPDDSNAKKAFEPVATLEQQPTVHARRHSTRNRPMSTKALEAFAMDILPTKQKRKFKDVFPEEKPSPSRRAHGRARVTEDLIGGMNRMTDLQAEEKGNVPCNDKGDKFKDPHI